MPIGDPADQDSAGKADQPADRAGQDDQNGDDDARDSQPPAPEPKPRPAPPTMPAATFVQSGGFSGRILSVQIDGNGNWSRQENRNAPTTGKLTAAQITKLNTLLRSTALADEARRAAATNDFREQCPDGINRGLDSLVDLASGTCGSNQPVPTFSQVTSLMVQ